MRTSNFGSFNFFRLSGYIAFLILLAFAISSPAVAQPVLGAKNTALGSGGTAYLTGYEATFWNPANLAIHDRHGAVHLGIGQAGVLYEPVLSSDIAGDQFFNFTDSFYPYKPSATNITTRQRNTILENNYPRDRLVSQHQTRADIILGGISWRGKDAVFSIAARARFASRIEVGRGWYSSEFISSGDGQEIRDFTLHQQINQLYEISFGYARKFTYINGLFSSLNELYIGISPKIVLAGPSFDANYNGRYIKSEGDKTIPFVTDFSYRTTGQYSSMTTDYLASGDPQAAIDRHLNKKLTLNNTGYGAGFDFGLTYLIPIGSDLPFLDRKNNPGLIPKSIRIAFSINDIGMIRYNEHPFELSSGKDTLQVGRETVKEDMFIGAGGQYLTYFDEANALLNPVTSGSDSNNDNFSTLLPTSLNAGVMLDLSRIKLMGDLTLGLNNTAFTSTKLTFNTGMEVRALPSIPIRVGTRIADGLPTQLGMGTGLETRYWDFNVGTQIIIRSKTFTTEFVGGAIASLQLHL